MKTLIAILFFVLFFSGIQKQEKEVVPSNLEWELYDIVNNYRKQRKLPEIPFSKSLTQVAQEHCKDLSENIGSLTHGWSDCPYDNKKRSTYSCMWEQPKNRTSYPGFGYENAYMHSEKALPKDAFESWKKSPAHHAVMINSGAWKDRKWNAIGVGIHGQFACIWFGEEIDPAGSFERKEQY